LDAIVATDLGSLVRSEWASLIADHGFRVISEDAFTVILHGDKVGIIVARDRGELAVSAFLLSDGEPSFGWQYEGMVGKASEPRLLQIAMDRLVEDPRILAGDPSLYEQISQTTHRLAREWTDYYARKGPRPKTGRLP
jgi:hypothetical protein